MDNKKLAVCAMFENEARYLPEWLAYHRLAGVAEFVLYDNGSTDDPALAIRGSPFAEHVTLIHWRQRPGQLAAYKHFIDIFAPGFDWVAFLDVDQFLLPLGRDTVVAALQSLDHAAAVLVQRRVFGPGAWQEAPPGLVIENYDRCAGDDDPANQHVATIARCSALLGVTDNPHEFRVNGSVFNTAGHLVPNNAIQVQPCYENLVVNHYHTRSRQDFLAKLSRAEATTRQDAPGLFDHLASVCQVRDATIQSFAAAVRASLGLDAMPAPPTETLSTGPLVPEIAAAETMPEAAAASGAEARETAASAAAASAAAALPEGHAPTAASGPIAASLATQTPQAADVPGMAPDSRVTPPDAVAPAPVQAPAWVTRGQDAQERTGGLALVFRDRSRGGEHWLAALRGAAVAAIDPAFLHDDYDRIRDFPTAAEARAACDAALARQARH
jgi:Glycosyl transferase family 2